MIFYLKIGFRNLMKHYRRSIKTILTVVIGLSACLLLQGFISYTLWGLKESLINGGLGHFQVYQQGFLQQTDEPYQYLIPDYSTVMEAIRKIPNIKLLAPRLNFQGIISYNDKSTIFQGTAGIPKEEEVLNSFITLQEGTFLDLRKPYGIMIGNGVARKLNVAVGDTVTLTSALKDGGVNAIDAEVLGIIGVQIKAYDDVVLFANLKTIQNFIDIPNSVDRLIVLLDNSKNLRKFEPTLRQICAQLNLEYQDWSQLAGRQYTLPKLFFELIYLLVMSIVVLVVIFSIINTLNLAMLERVREIGTMRSLGTTRLQVVKLFLAESFLIGFIGGLCGILLGYGLAALLNLLGGVPIPPPPGQARGYIALFKPDLINAFKLWLLFLLTAVIAGIYPAVRGSRLRIVDALRWI
jgi:putative ABC transport system permease protein